MGRPTACRDSHASRRVHYRCCGDTGDPAQHLPEADVAGLRRTFQHSRRLSLREQLRLDVHRAGIQVSSDPVLIAQMVDVGLIGLLGLVAGLFVVPPVGDVVLRAVQTPKRTLDPIAFALALVGAVAFSWVASPSATIFDTATNSTSVADKLNFGAAYMVSYLIFALLFMDTERESQVGVRAAKGWVLAAAAAYVVIFLQLLRGDRESSGMLAAFAALYLTSPAGLKADTPRRFREPEENREVDSTGVAALVVFVGLGAIRYNASTLVRTLSPVQIVRLGSAQSTWTAVLWTNLSAASAVPRRRFAVPLRRNVHRLRTGSSSWPHHESYRRVTTHRKGDESCVRGSGRSFVAVYTRLSRHSRSWSIGCRGNSVSVGMAHSEISSAGAC